jgi:hypothetical protein
VPRVMAGRVPATIHASPSPTSTREPAVERSRSDQLATVVIAMFNGMAVEQLADPHGVPKDLYGQALDLLLG